MGETSKARTRREKEVFFEKYCQGRGVDLGCGDDPVTPEVEQYDRCVNPAHDGTLLPGLSTGAYDFVYSSHLLEHLEDPILALKNWWDLLKAGGYLILLLPHRDLYEKKLTMPSVNNPDHKFFILPARSEPPCTYGVVDLVNRACPGHDFIYLKLVEQYGIECVVRKP